MFKFSLNKNNYEFVIYFDVPVDSESANHKEFASFLSGFAKNADGRLIYNNNNELTGIDGKLDSFFNIADKLLLPNEFNALNDLINNALGYGSTSIKEGRQINFHQNPFDTPQRYWNFILDQGNFTDYFFNRLAWYIAPNSEYVTKFPLHVDIESASTCNMNGPMCYQDKMNKTGQMKFELFRRIVDECVANNVFSVRLSWRRDVVAS